MSWNSYPVVEDGQTTYITWNVGMYDRAPDRTRPVRFEATLTLRDPDERGLPSETELAALEVFRDALEADIVQATDGRYVLRTTGSGSQCHTFYAPSHRGIFRKKSAQTLFANAVAELAKEFPDYPLVVVDSEDEEWDAYLDAFPSEDPVQWFADARAVSALVLAGDPLTGPRAVDHTVLFETEASRDALLADAQAADFEVVESSTVEPEAPSDPEAADADPVLKVVLRRVEPSVFLHPLHEAVMILVALAGTHEAEYAGWVADRPDDSGEEE